MHTQTSTEYWVRRGSLAHTDTQGNDLPQPEGVRVYLLVQLAAFRRSGVEGADARHRRRIVQCRVHLDAVSRGAGRDGSVGDRRHAASRQPHSDARRRHAGGHCRVAQRFPGDPWRRHAAHAEPAAAAGFRTGRGAAASCGSLRRLVPGGNTPGAPGKMYTVLVPAVDRDGNDVPGCARRWWRRRWALTPAGICVLAASATARSFGSRAATFRLRRSAAERAGHRRSAPFGPGALSGQGGVCCGDRRRGARVGGAGSDAGRGRRTLRCRRGKLGPAAACRDAGVIRFVETSGYRLRPSAVRASASKKARKLLTRRKIENHGGPRRRNSDMRFARSALNSVSVALRGSRSSSVLKSCGLASRHGHHDKMPEHVRSLPRHLRRHRT